MLNAFSSAAALAASFAYWLSVSRKARSLQHIRADHHAAPNEDMPAVTTVLEMIAVAVRQGASVPKAVWAVGKSVRGELGECLCNAAQSLRHGYAWDEAWRAARPDDIDHSGSKTTSDSAKSAIEGMYRDIEDALADAWNMGVSPVGRLEAAIERADAAERSAIEQSAARLTVRLLLPTGLCFLPAFLCIAVIPSIASFVM